jgi:bacteriorhodopsin
MADSNPLKTQRLLQKSLVQQRSANEGDSGSKQTAAIYDLLKLISFVLWYSYYVV